MKLLYLGYEDSVVLDWLKARYDITVGGEITDEYDYTISYGYRRIITKEEIDRANPIINLHISYLPWNRGADPNYWSWVEGTPKGVTIHRINEGIDTGPIYARQTVNLSLEDTLESSYLKLRVAIEALFMNVFEEIVSGERLAIPQPWKGSYHNSKDMPELENGWKTKVGDLCLPS